MNTAIGIARKLQLNLSDTYRDRIEGDSSTNIQASIDSSKLAIEVCTRSKFPKEWAMMQINLGLGYWNIIEGDSSANLEQSIHHYRLGLEIYTRIDYPESWALTHVNLAVAYEDRIQGNREYNVNLAVEGYQNALGFYQQQNPTSLEYFKTARNLGNLYYQIGNWQDAIDIFAIALTTFEGYDSWVISENSRRRLLEDAVSIKEKSIQCSIKINQ